MVLQYNMKFCSFGLKLLKVDLQSLSYVSVQVWDLIQSSKAAKIKDHSGLAFHYNARIETVYR